MKPISTNSKILNTRPASKSDTSISTSIFSRNEDSSNSSSLIVHNSYNDISYPLNTKESKEDNKLITENSSYKEEIINIPSNIKSPIIPTGSMNIVQNGVYNIINYSQANVEVELPGEVYDGEYVITPSTKENIVLDTDNKIVENDITIRKLPFYETHNIYGTTIYIG